MSRRIVSPAEASRASVGRAGAAVALDASPVPLAADTYGSRLLKLIPAEVVTLFVTLDGIIRTAGTDKVPAGMYWGVFAVMLVGAYFFSLRQMGAGGAKPLRGQAALTTLSFLVWVFAVGGPFTYPQATWYLPVYGSILLPLYTFGVPFFYKGANTTS